VIDDDNHHSLMYEPVDYSMIDKYDEGEVIYNIPLAAAKVKLVHDPLSSKVIIYQ
jgi:hypothetical protein